nr:DnaJ protein homolog 1-like [Ipomoea batatas]
MGDHHPKSPRTTNFHNILGISRTATLVDICKAYKCLVRKWHPDRNSLNRDEAQAKFTSINEAYRALSMKKREEAGGGSSDGEEQMTPKNSEQKSPKISDLEEEDQEFVISSPTLLSRTTSRIAPEVSRKMSQSASRRSRTATRQDFYTHLQRTTSTPTTPTGEPSLQSILTGKKISTPIIYSQSIARRKPQPVEQKLECTLEELCYGRVKVAKITREVISSSGLIVREEEYVTIVVQPGWKKGTRITFEGKGDERPGMLPADVIFTIEEKIHPVFKREGDDLELGVEIPLVQALTGCTITVPLLGDESMTLELDDIIYPGYEMTVPGQGMPKPKDLEGQGMPKPKDFEGQRGDLLLKFLVEFPTDLSDEQRAEAARILQDCS